MVVWVSTWSRFDEIQSSFHRLNTSYYCNVAGQREDINALKLLAKERIIFKNTAHSWSHPIKQFSKAPILSAVQCGHKL